MGLIMESQNIMGLDYGSNISVRHIQCSLMKREIESGAEWNDPSY